ncbi:hypothetical protein [Bacillus sp. JCM 19034]|uniref:hypothetical protein n=1 Tax=Bacillus sp. JCM 19034 TaxID=1481928 RepID=UPI000A7C99E5|nr:hypothetical protein [Bacillus sp. JCM 19034]
MDKWNAFRQDQLNIVETDRGLFKGKSFAVKDVFAVKGLIAGAGNLIGRRLIQQRGIMQSSSKGY